MTNYQVYKKTLPFSLIQFGVDVAALLVVVGLATAGFFISDLIGLGIGLVLGIIIAVLVNFFVSNRIKAAHIAMITKGVTEDKLPDKSVKAGFNEIKGRFGKITVFFLITRAIKGIFHQLGRTINKVGTAVGGDVGNTVTSVIDTGIQIVVGYLCDCCLGWVLYRKDINSFKAGCEGAVIFFKHGKTLIRNIGRIFGMGFLSLLLIGGAFFGIFCLIFFSLPSMFESLTMEIQKIFIDNGDEIPQFLSNPTFVTLFVAAILGIVLWSMIHSVLIRPFILVGVMRNYMAAGQAHIPTEEEFKEVAAKSPKFAQLQSRIE